MAQKHKKEEDDNSNLLEEEESDKVGKEKYSEPRSMDEEDEEEENDEENNDYEKDGFVVSDEEYMESKKEKKKKRLKKGDKNTIRNKKKKRFQRDADDNDLIQENLQLLESQRSKKQNIQLSDDEDGDDGGADYVDEDAASDNDMIDEDDDDDNQNARKKKPKKKAQNISEDDEDEEEEDLEEVNEIRQKWIRDQIMDPTQIESGFNNEEDKKIRGIDFPERLQLRYKSRNQPTEHELSVETVWIFKKFKQQLKQDKEKQKYNIGGDQKDALKYNITQESENIYHKKIRTILSFIREKGYEIMYIYYYKRNEFMPELDEEDLWKIYDLDEEWAQFSYLKEYLDDQIKKLDQLFKVNIKIVNNMETTLDIQTLNFIKDYVKYQRLKYQTEIDIAEQAQSQALLGRVKQTNQQYHTKFISIMVQKNIHLLVQNTFLTPDQLSENLHKQNYQRIFPPGNYQLEKTPEQASFEFIDSENPYFSSQLKTLESICKFNAIELFHQPLLKQWVYNKYQEEVLISTKPTEKGKTEIDILHQFYCVKRIKDKKFEDFKDDLFLKIQLAEQQGLISVTYLFKWEEKNVVQQNIKDDIQERLINNYIYPTDAADHHLNEEQVNYINQWNFLRVEVLRLYLQTFMYPFCQKLLKKQLREKSEKFIIKECTKKFKDLLLTAPWKDTTEQIEQSLQQQKQQNCVMSVVMEPQTSHLTIAFVNGSGELLSQLEIQKYQSNFPSGQDKKIEFSMQEEKNNNNPENPKQKLENVMKKYTPQLIVVAANCIGARRIKRDMLHFVSNKLTKWVTWGDDMVPQMVAKDLKNDPKYKIFSHNTILAISLGRMMQNTMAETLTLWNENPQKNSCLIIPFHPLQQYVSKESLQSEYEKVAVQVVNNVGVNINQILKHKHLENQLQFVSGLGPRKAQDILEKIYKKDLEDKSGDYDKKLYIVERLDLYYLQYIPKCVFLNCAGFFKIEGKCPLDRTRIHTENKTLAQKICSDALEEEDDPKNDTIMGDKYESIKKIMEKPQILNELDFEEYAKHLSEVKKKDNFIYILQFIMAELSNPFQDPRESYKEMTDQELFYKLTRESPQSFKKYSIVSAKIEKIFTDNPEKLVVNIMDNNLKATIMKSDIDFSLFEEEDNKRNKNKNNENKKPLNEYFKEGQIIKAIVKRIGALEKEKKVQPEKVENDILNVELTMKKEWQKTLIHFYPELQKNKNFTVNEKEDYPKFLVNIQKSTQYHVRKINHPKYKHQTMQAAIDYIKDQSIGEFVIRPSSRGPEYLVITWKFYEKVIVHLQIKEERMTVNSTPKFILNNEEYFSLDQIIENYVVVCNGLMNGIIAHKKFLYGTMTQLEQKLLEDKRQQPNIIHYYFGCFEEFPQYIVLLYVHKDTQIIKEYIKVKYFGLHFHDQYFPQLKDVVVYFKKEYNTDEYKRYVRKRKAPYQDNGQNTQTFGSSNFQVKQEYHVKNEFHIKNEYSKGVKQERNIKAEIKGEYGSSQTKCTHCNQVGHSANVCSKSRTFIQSDMYSNTDKENSNTNRSTKKTCYHCGSENHLAKECNRTKQICRSCQSEGHQSKDCPNRNRKPRSRSRSLDKEKEKTKKLRDNNDVENNY